MSTKEISTPHANTSILVTDIYFPAFAHLQNTHTHAPKRRASHGERETAAAATAADLDGEPSAAAEEEERFLREQNKFPVVVAVVVPATAAIAVSALCVVTYLLCISQPNQKPNNKQHETSTRK